MMKHEGFEAPIVIWPENEPSHFVGNHTDMALRAKKNWERLVPKFEKTITFTNEEWAMPIFGQTKIFPFGNGASFNIFYVQYIHR